MEYPGAVVMLYLGLAKTALTLLRQEPAWRYWSIEEKGPSKVLLWILPASFWSFGATFLLSHSVF